jgi:hypothetical protein
MVKIIVANKPAERKGELSEEQKQNQKRFQETFIYAKASIADPNTKAAYKAAAAEVKTVYNVAVADFMHAPDIDEVDVGKYHQ